MLPTSNSFSVLSGNVFNPSLSLQSSAQSSPIGTVLSTSTVQFPHLKINVPTKTRDCHHHLDSVPHYCFCFWEGKSTDPPVMYITDVHSGEDQRKQQSCASLAFVRVIQRWPVNSLHKGLVTRKMFPFDDVIMGYCNSNSPLFCSHQLCCTAGGLVLTWTPVRVASNYAPGLSYLNM